MIYDYFRVSGAHDTVFDYAHFSLLMAKIPSDDVLESLYKLRIRESDQLNNCIRIVRHGDSPEDIDAQLSEAEDDGEEKTRSETPIAKL